MIKFIFLVLFAISAYASPGGDLTGNGGHGVICGFAPIAKNGVYLLDTFESPKLPRNVLKISFTDAKNFFISKLESEFNEGEFAEVYNRIEKEAYLVDDLSFTKMMPQTTGDFGFIDPTLLLGDLDGCRLVQIIIYSNDRAFINRIIFNALSSFDQAALFTHEALYYLYRKQYGVMNSNRVREKIQSILE